MKRNENRTLKTYEAYQEYKRAQADKSFKDFSFHEDPSELVKEYEHWIIRKNKFPYDLLFEKHDMLIPKRLFGYSDEMTEDEKREYTMILDEVSSGYDGILENFTHARSVTAHFHPHLFTYKKIDIDSDTTIS